MAPVRARHTRLDLGVIVAVAVVACARVAAATASHIDLSLLASSAGSAAKAPRIPCQWTDPVSRHKFDLTGLMLPNSAYLFRDTMTDAEHDSVHARQPPPPPPPSKVTGRQLDQGKAVKASTGGVPPAETGGGGSTSRSGYRAPKSQDEYDFWVVVPKEEDHSDEEELEMFDDYERRAIAREKAMQAEDASRGGQAGEAQTSGGDGQPKQLHRAARGRPEAKECHSLGALDNVTWSVITARAPAHGVSLTYHGGDQCLKRVVTRKPAENNNKKLNTWKKPNQPDASAVPVETTEVQWVPTPRTLTLHIRCDPEDTGVKDFASFLQLTRRVRVVESEMCEYVVEWPSALGCGTPPRGKALRAATALVHPRRWVWWLLAGGATVVGMQVKRQWHALAILRPALMRGDPAAWHRAKALLLSKDASVRARPKYSKVNHEV